MLTSWMLYSCNSDRNWECEGNCYTGYGIKRWDDGGYEKGNWTNGDLIGKGEQFFGTTSQFAGDKYVGGFDESGYNGYGIYNGKAGDFVYKGMWKNGKTDGHGKSAFGSRSSNPGWYYDGDWVQGKRTGHGILFMGTIGSHSGIKYIGTFLNDNMQGSGTYIWPDSSRYIGRFLDDYFEGEAKFIFSDGFVYTGNWHRGYNQEFLKVLDEHSKKAKDRDSILMKFFYRKDQ